ncbi:MAG: RtcB family protein [Anaerolineae bacterium]|nr:RtcB family protein [Anaerolineae bacterium]MCA9891521.1 RtcB family protein [Anaerolineae bacterium]MCB9460047.1 RtcB family protein [Anaerolineaceae bacterium]
MELRDQPVEYHIWGREYIDDASVDQLESAARLPVAVAGALMPDAHVGYGLPIGGVLATENAVIPYAVGVDIACRMRLSVYDVKGKLLKGQQSRLQNALNRETLFGAGKEWSVSERADHEVLDEDTWRETPLLRGLLDKATRQLGTSGSGNHFVEFGLIDIADENNPLHVPSGQYIALLSHSGSRGVGYQIADHYSKLAMESLPNLDKSVRHLAWLSMDSEEGQEYWQAMQLAGRFAAANHEVIHRRIAKAIGWDILATVENHHNFAWEEKHKGKRVIVHRKGATPAEQGMLGIIPGSMGDAGYVVQGIGNEESLKSASHGAGRVMSRSQARKQITRNMIRAYLKERDVTLFGGDTDEAPHVYKPIDEIIAAQSDLISVVAKFTPRIVRMDGK